MEYFRAEVSISGGHAGLGVNVGCSWYLDCDLVWPVVRSIADALSVCSLFAAYHQSQARSMKSRVHVIREVYPLYDDALDKSE